MNLESLNLLEFAQLIGGAAACMFFVWFVTQKNLDKVITGITTQSDKQIEAKDKHNDQLLKRQDEQYKATLQLQRDMMNQSFDVQKQILEIMRIHSGQMVRIEEKVDSILRQIQ